MKPPIEIARPCSADWTAMTGDDRKRLCAQCGKHVHNLSALTPAELRHFAEYRDGTECIGYVFRASGEIVTARPWSAAFRWLRSLMRGPVWLFALLLPTFLAGCVRSLGKPAMNGRVLPGKPMPITRNAHTGSDGVMVLGEPPTIRERKSENRLSGEAGIMIGRSNPARPSSLNQ